MIRVFLYAAWQCTWGFLQTLFGLVVFVINIKCRHYFYHGAVITEWNTDGTSMSLGLFVFMSTKIGKDCDCPPDRYAKTLVHEYGHTIQSLVLGPLYLIVIGIPSGVWAMIPAFSKIRKEKKISYFSLYTESWANSWGEKVTGECSMGKALID